MDLCVKVCLRHKYKGLGEVKHLPYAKTHTQIGVSDAREWLKHASELPLVDHYNSPYTMSMCAAFKVLSILDNVYSPITLWYLL